MASSSFFVRFEHSKKLGLVVATDSDGNIFPFPEGILKENQLDYLKMAPTDGFWADADREIINNATDWTTVWEADYIDEGFKIVTSPDYLFSYFIENWKTGVIGGLVMAYMFVSWL